MFASLAFTCPSFSPLASRFFREASLARGHCLGSTGRSAPLRAAVVHALLRRAGLLGHAADSVLRVLSLELALPVALAQVPLVRLVAPPLPEAVPELHPHIVRPRIAPGPRDRKRHDVSSPTDAPRRRLRAPLGGRPPDRAARPFGGLRLVAPRARGERLRLGDLARSARRVG